MVEVDIKVERERALIFSERKTTVHVSKIYDNPAWINGIILEVGNDFFLIKDRLNGKEYLVLFSELKKPIVIYGDAEQREDFA
jgi:hypothetical protein